LDVIGLYFGILLAVTWWTILKRKNSSTDYFLASRHIGWLVVGAAIFASNIGSEHLVGLAGSGPRAAWQWLTTNCTPGGLLVSEWVMVPFYLRSGVFTMPEFLERRYTPAARWVLSIVSLVSYVMTKFAVGMAAGGVVFEVLFPNRIFADIPNFWVGAVGVVAVTAVYAILGGLTRSCTPRPSRQWCSSSVRPRSASSDCTSSADGAHCAKYAPRSISTCGNR